MFRAWDKVSKEMLRVVSIDYDEKFIWGLAEVEIDLVSENSYSFDEIELTHFTGLYDKNDIEIYQSDIVYDEHIDEYGVVVNKQGCTWFEFETHAELAFERCDVLEVVGNIYQNEELLKGVKK